MVEKLFRFTIFNNPFNTNSFSRVVYGYKKQAFEWKKQVKSNLGEKEPLYIYLKEFVKKKSCEEEYYYKTPFAEEMSDVDVKLKILRGNNVNLQYYKFKEYIGELLYVHDKKENKFYRMCKYTIFDVMFRGNWGIYEFFRGPFLDIIFKQQYDIDGNKNKISSLVFLLEREFATLEDLEKDFKSPSQLDFTPFFKNNL